MLLEDGLTLNKVAMGELSVLEGPRGHDRSRRSHASGRDFKNPLIRTDAKIVWSPSTPARPISAAHRALSTD